jgi:hypothetical protein
MPSQREDFQRVLLEEGYEAVVKHYLQPTPLSRHVAARAYHLLKRVFSRDGGGRIK